jgi:hypothetical protein
LEKLCASQRQHLDAAARWLGVSLNVVGKECLHDCEADLSAAFGQVIAALADGSWIAQRAIQLVFLMLRPV